MSTIVSKKPKVIPARWRKLLLLVPGYDSIATAGNCTFDVVAADQAIEFIETCLTHVKGELGGKPFLLEPWEKAIIGNLFGWKRLDGTRRYREALVYVPRKNGKSALCAAIILLILFIDKEPGAELYSAAADREQAALVYDQAKGMVLQEPELESRCQIYATNKSIVRPDVASSYKAISADANTKHGYNTHAAIIDELHAQPNRDLVDVLMTSTGARRQPLIIHITTSDFDRESICNEKHLYASKVRDGIIVDQAFLPVIYEASNEDDWTDPKVWAKANPNLGISKSLEYMQRECKRAQDEPSYENTFKRLDLNIKTTSNVVWLPMAAWDGGVKYGPFISTDFEGGRHECFVGLDLATTTDVAAAAFLFPPTSTHPWRVLMRFWIPGDNARKRERRDRVPYETWAKQGLITMTEGNVIDYDVIRRDLNELGKTYRIKKLAIDRWNASQITTQLMGDGFDVVEFGQGYASMNAPAKELEKLVLGQQLAHGSNPVLRWMASNCMVETDAAGNIKPSKAKSTEKIDGIVALIMALGVGLVDDGYRVGKYYETHDVEFV